MSLDLLRLGFATATLRERAQAFCRLSLNVLADGHGFADAFHLRGERECWPCASTGLPEFLEGKKRPAMAGLVTT